MQPPAVVLKKSAIGYVYIYLTGIILTLGIAWIVRTVLVTDYADASVVIALSVIALGFDLLGMLIFGYTYSLNRVIITKTTVTVYNYPSLSTPQIVEAPVAEIEDVSTKQPGILGMLFGYGTLRVQTAGTHPDLTLPMISNPQRWELYLVQLHDKLEPTPVQP